MSKEQIRLECLKLAVSQNHGGNPVRFARQFSDFVFGTSDAEVINAARELAEKVKIDD
jgi:hypothetical protein